MQWGEDGVDGDALVEPKLLPGSKELLVIRRGRLELWSVERQGCIWTVPTASDGLVCLAFQFELVSSGELIIATIDVEEGFAQT
jgi:hypothetical protein